MQAVQGTHVVPVDRTAVLQLVASVGIPMMPVIATQVQLADLAKWIIGKIL